MSNVYKCFVLICFLDGAAAFGFLSVFIVLVCDYSCQNNYLRLRRLWWLSFKVLCIIGNYWKLVNVRIGADIILLSRIGFFYARVQSWQIKMSEGNSLYIFGDQLIA